MLNRIRELWKTRRNLVVGAGMVVLIALAAAYFALPRDESTPEGGPVIEVSGLGAGQRMAGEDRRPAINFGELGPELFNERVQQFMKESEKRWAEQSAFDRQVIEEIRGLKEKPAEGVKPSQMANLEIGLRDIRDQLDALRAGGLGVAGGPGQERKISPVQIIVTPERKDERPRSEVGGPGEIRPVGARGDFYLPPGSLVQVRTLNGVSAYPATAGAGSEFPVAVVIMDNWMAPNDYSIPMKGCTVLGKADGDLSSERVRIRTHLFSCVFPGGRTLDRPLKGWVAGPDGWEGIKGKVTDRRGRKLGLSFIAGFAAGLGQAFSMQEVTRVVSADGTERQIVTGDALTHASTSALSQAMADIAKFMREEAGRLMPTVDIPGGVDGTLFTEEGIDIPEIVNLFYEEGIQ